VTESAAHFWSRHKKREDLVTCLQHAKAERAHTLAQAQQRAISKLYEEDDE